MSVVHPEGTKLTFHYRGFLEDGSVFTDSTGKEPMTHIVGHYGIMPQMEQALSTMEVEDECTVDVGMAYGEYDQKAVQTRILRYTIAGGDTLQEGQELMWTSPSNPAKPVPARIVRSDEYSFDIDFNHPLAGKNLSYWVKLMAVD